MKELQFASKWESVQVYRLTTNTRSISMEEVKLRTTLRLSGPGLVRMRRTQVYIASRNRSHGLPTMSDVVEFLLAAFDRSHQTPNDEIGNDITIDLEARELMNANPVRRTICPACSESEFEITATRADSPPIRRCRNCGNHIMNGLPIEKKG